MLTEENLSSNWLKLKRKGKVSKPRKPKSKPATESETTEKVLNSILKDEEKLEKPKQKSPTELALWAKDQDINMEDLQKVYSVKSLTPDSRKTQLGKFLAIDCEFVGVGPEGGESSLARISVVNFYGHLVFDSFVKQREKVVDWRTWVSGVKGSDMKTAIPFKQAQEKTAELLKDRILVGHAVQHDLDALFLSHPKSLIRDTSRHLPFRKISNGKTPGLRKLAKEFLKIDIQAGEHSSVEDARATMLLYRLHKKEFEQAVRDKYGRK